MFPTSGRFNRCARPGSGICQVRRRRPLRSTGSQARLMLATPAGDGTRHGITDARFRSFTCTAPDSQGATHGPGPAKATAAILRRRIRPTDTRPRRQPCFRIASGCHPKRRKREEGSRGEESVCFSWTLFILSVILLRVVHLTRTREPTNHLKRLPGETVRAQGRLTPHRDMQAPPRCRTRQTYSSTYIGTPIRLSLPAACPTPVYFGGSPRDFARCISAVRRTASSSARDVCVVVMSRSQRLHASRLTSPELFTPRYLYTTGSSLRKSTLSSLCHTTISATSRILRCGLPDTMNCRWLIDAQARARESPWAILHTGLHTD